MRAKIGICLAVVTLLFSGCTTYGYKTRLGESTYASVDYHKVKLLFAVPDRPYEVIGVVSVQGGITASAGDMYRKLLKSAAELGADAVIVTGERANKAILPGTTTTTVNANTYGYKCYCKLLWPIWGSECQYLRYGKYLFITNKSTVTILSNFGNACT